MKKRKVVLLIILTALLIALIFVGCFVFKNFNTIKTMYYVFTGQDEVIKTINTETDKIATEAIKEQGVENIRPLTEEEANKLNSGEMTEEEAIEIILGKNEENVSSKDTTPNNSNAESVSGNAGTSKEESPTVSNEEVKKEEEIKKKKEEIASLIGKMYVLKAQFTGKLAGIEGYVETEYRKLVDKYGYDIPSSEKTRVGMAAYENALALEAECDGQVKTILDRVEVLLKETGQNTALVKQMQEAYESEKMVAKSHYMSLI